MKAIQQVLFLLCIIILSYSQAYTQTTTYRGGIRDIVELKNGGRIVGKILSKEEDGTIKIGTRDKSIFVFNRSEVASITKGRPQRWQEEFSDRHFQLSKKGYYAITELGILAGSAPQDYYGNRVALQLNTIHGYRFAHFLWAGAGAGINFFDEGNTLPLFLDLRGDILKRTVSPHVYVQGGYQLNLVGDETLRQGGERFLEISGRGGLVAGAGIGMHFHTRGQASYILSAGYRLQRSTYSQFDQDGFGFEDEIEYQRIAIQFGSCFDQGSFLTTKFLTAYKG